MARYTLNLSEIVETLMNDDLREITMNPYDYIDELVERAVPVIFSDKVKIFVFNDGATPERIEIREEDRLELLKKILKHYWDYETSASTPFDFIFRLNKKLDEIMPYFNQLYASAELEFDPFDDVNYTRRTKTDNTEHTIEDNNADHKHTGSDVNVTEKTGRDLTTDTTTGDVTDRIDRDGYDTTTTTKTGTDTLGIDGTKRKTGTEATDYNVTDTDNGGGSSNGSTSGNKWDFYNDTPQGKANWGNLGLQNNPNNPDGSFTDGSFDAQGNIEIDYLSRYEKHLDAGSRNNTTTTNNNTHHKTGTETKTFNTSETHNETDTTTYNNQTVGRTDYASGETDKTTYNTEQKSQTDWGNKVESTDTYDSNLNVKEDKDKDFTHDGLKVEQVTGKMNRVSYSERLMLFRNTILNIDELIIKALKELFFKII